MRLAPLAFAAALLVFGVWGAASAAPDLQFTDPAVPAGDAARGAGIYKTSCGGCHSLDANRVGPAHRGVVGRIAGTAPGFNYSPPLKAAGFTWTPGQLDKWLMGPPNLVKGTRMFFRLPDAQQRADVIAYLIAEGAKTPE